jgi:hypothetical protein
MSAAVAVPSRTPETILRVGGVTVVLDRRHREVRWERPNTRSMHLDEPIALAVAQAIVRAAYCPAAGEVARIARSSGYVTRIWRNDESSVCVQTDGRFPGPIYFWGHHDALRVADALLYGVRVLGGWR